MTVRVSSRVAAELRAATGNGEWPVETVLADIVEEWAGRYDAWTPPVRPAPSGITRGLAIAVVVAMMLVTTLVGVIVVVRHIDHVEAVEAAEVAER